MQGSAGGLLWLVKLDCGEALHLAVLPVSSDASLSLIPFGKIFVKITEERQL